MHQTAEMIMRCTFRMLGNDLVVLGRIDNIRRRTYYTFKALGKTVSIFFLLLVSRCLSGCTHHNVQFEWENGQSIGRRHPATISSARLCCNQRLFRISEWTIYSTHDDASSREKKVRHLRKWSKHCLLFCVKWIRNFGRWWNCYSRQRWVQPLFSDFVYIFFHSGRVNAFQVPCVCCTAIQVKNLLPAVIWWTKPLPLSLFLWNANYYYYVHYICEWRKKNGNKCKTLRQMANGHVSSAFYLHMTFR